MTIPIIFAALVVLFIAVSALLYRIGFYPILISPEKAYKMEVEKGRLADPEEYKTWPFREIQVYSPHGYTLYGQYFPLEGSQKTAVLSHGIGYNLYGSIKYMPIFRKRGFNILIYDNRYHGRSGGPNCTYGATENEDLKAVVDWAFSQLGPNGKVGTHGESLGAAISLHHAAIDPRISFAIADCSFSNLRELFKVRIRADYHLPAFPFVNLAGWLSSYLLGFGLEDASPIFSIPRVTPPVLFIHGQEDHYIPPSMSQDLYDHKLTGVRCLYLVPGAGHANALVTDREEYDRQVGIFLDQINREF